MGDCRQSSCSGDDGPAFTCKYCNQKYCSDHRLPENHTCAGLAYTERQGKHLEGWHDTLENDDSRSRRRTRGPTVTLGDDDSDDTESESDPEDSDPEDSDPEDSDSQDTDAAEPTSESRTYTTNSERDNPVRDHDYDNTPRQSDSQGTSAKAMDTSQAPKYSTPKKGGFGNPSPDVNPDGSIKRSTDDQPGHDWSTETDSSSVSSILREHWMAVLVVVYLVFLVVLFQL